MILSSHTAALITFKILEVFPSRNGTAKRREASCLSLHRMLAADPEKA
jgi:hypothetical protein